MMCVVFLLLRFSSPLLLGVAFVYLKGGLVVVVLDVLVGSSEQQNSGAAVLQREAMSRSVLSLERDGSASPGCTEHRGAAPCFLRHSGSSCRPRRTEGAPGAARCRSDRPEKHRLVGEQRMHPSP